MDHDASNVPEGSFNSISPNSGSESSQDAGSTRVIEVAEAQAGQRMDKARDNNIAATAAQHSYAENHIPSRPQQQGIICEFREDGGTSIPTSPARAEGRSIALNEASGAQLHGASNGSINTGQAPRSLIDNPPNLAKIRQVMFECREPIEISLQEFETYWPFIDNVWVKQRSNSSKEGHCTTDYYMCRLRRPTHRSSDTRPLPEGKRPRRKRVREGGLCNFQIKVIRFEGAYQTVTIARTPGSSHEHSHDLDYIDKVKRNSGLMEFARREASKGYLPSSIYTKFREEPGKLIEAGGKFCTVTDVRNVSAKWRLQNPEVRLVPHEGYEYQKGHGIVRTRAPGSDNSTAPADSSAPPTTLPHLPPDTLTFPQFALDFLEPYLPKSDEKREFPHVTLSYASSMDSKISLLPGMQTVLSGPEAKLMTHYLRSRHDAILIGVGTVLADNPGLNCRLQGAGGFGGLGRMWQPRPVVIDPMGRWPVHPDCRMLRTAVEGKGRAPWVVVSPGAQIHPQKLMMLKGYGGDYLRIMEYHHNWRLRWEPILRALASEGIKSVMIEGGGRVLSELLNPEYTEFIDSIVVTIAPTYLGSGGVGVSPDSKRDATGKPNAALNPQDVTWTPMGQNVVMCGKIRTAPPPPPTTTIPPTERRPPDTSLSPAGSR
ncbi:dihydrofolate reductase-like domain-containing protein [Aspergillus egyptiacus]|nr:dihydrofolate reductase-like domain-containing protein [Aspergillus egyptiacus]